MRKITNKPHLIFWISIPIIILMGILHRNEMLDVNIQSTYYVFSKTDLAIVISILFAIIGFGYWIMQKANRKLSILLSFIHIALTFGGILLIWILAQLFRESKMEYNFNNNLTLGIYFISLIVIFGQIIFPINIAYGILKKNQIEAEVN